MDYRDELRLCLQQALLQERDSLPQPGTVTPIFWDKTRRPGPIVEMGTGRSLSSGRPKAGPVGRCNEIASPWIRGRMKQYSLVLERDRHLKWRALDPVEQI